MHHLPKSDSFDFMSLSEDILNDDFFPTPIQIEACIGKERFSEYQTASNKSDFLWKVGVEFEKSHTNKKTFDGEFRDVFCYTLAAALRKPKHIQDYSHIIHNIKIKYTFGSYDSRLENIIKLCNKHKKAIAQTTLAKFSHDDVSLITNSKHLSAMLQEMLSQKHLTLRNRLDMSYKIYLRTSELLAKSQNISNSVSDENIKLILLKQQAIQFMELILSVKGEKNIEQQMNLIKHNKRILDKEYIPGLEVKSDYKIEMTTEMKEQDKIDKIIYLDAESRDEYRVIIKDGYFVQRQPNNTFKHVDTSLNISHNKYSYAAFVINMNGEISVFNHFDSDDRMAHSSMFADEPIFIAGELQIVDGKLKAVTDHSGHYKPKVQDVYSLLKYLRDQKIDLTDVQVNLVNEIKDLPPIAKTHDRFWYKAIDLINKFESPSLQSSSSIFDDRERKLSQSVDDFDKDWDPFGTDSKADSTDKRDSKTFRKS